MKYLFCLMIMMLTAASAFAQSKVRKLPPIINHPSLNLYAPFMSADANAIVFLSDNAEDNALIPYYSSRESGDWKTPQELPKHINTRLNFNNGFSLSADGKTLFYTSQKTPTVGGYDLWMCKVNGNTWGEAVNMAPPLNTKKNDACPSVSVDGTMLYFMRCETMDPNSANGCKIYRAEKKLNGQWSEPEELPATINTGNSQSPRIMADGETLIFASDKMGGKGGMDLYQTRFANGKWSSPVALDFINTEKDDQYVSVTALGRYILKDTPGTRTNELVEFLIPDEYKPKGMMKVEGKSVDPSIPAYVSLVDLMLDKEIYSGKVAKDGSFMLYIKEGSIYELSVVPEHSDVNYFAKVYDLTSDKIAQTERVSVALKPFAVNDVFDAGQIVFKNNTSELDEKASSHELQRLLRAVKGNPSLKFDIQLTFSGYTEDSIFSHADLTESRYDSIETIIEDIDSLGQLIQVKQYEVKQIFHNDRTQKQAEAIIQYLTRRGADPSRLSYSTSVQPTTEPSEKITTVKIAIRTK